MVTASALFNHLDGLDYRRIADLNAGVVAEASRSLATAAPGDAFTFVNRTNPDPLIGLVKAVRGREKVFFVREAAVHGAVYLGDLATLALDARGLVAREQACKGALVEFGGGPPVSSFCFRVDAR
ncbi:MAG: hypothetical protein ACRD1P_07925, partial [Thermoanaerobaculia bacterium]